ncbi:restriction endonuclease subunit S [Lentilactobacillus diolivorans]|uniref:restriction endonuclease subunit S n=2 Tax=Lactobacillaceae TaxID=33958 RepID=UPI002469A6D2|nr:restriction endonuclease subunit S [Lentilactobacillus diolivorans]MDH5107061.1 restriction endonuclease subunit S [Lentilactobacillus diolivorans]
MAKIDDSVKKKVPELRFKGFTDEWEERKLKDIAQFNPKTVLPDEFEYVDLESVVGTEMISHRTESKDQAPSRAQRLAQKGDVFYQTVRPYQMNNYLYDLPYDNYVFSTGYAQMRPNIDSYFLLNSVQNKQFVQHVLDRSTGTSYPAINSSDLSNIEIHVPSKLSEQQKIGAFFQSIDDTIALHQRKLAKLKELKQGYLQKLFPKNGSKFPQLRFAGFADAWEQDKLDYIFDILDGDRGKNYPSESDFLEEGPTLFLDTGNVRKNGFLFNTTKYITKERDCSLRSGKLQLFDFVLTSRGTLGNVAYYDKKTHVEYQSVRINSAMLILRPIRRNIFSDLYLKVVLHGNLIENFMKKNHVGSAQPHITKKDFSKMLVGIPSTFKEQQKIGLFFKQLDNTITLHQRKLDLLKEQKKGFLQNMFV